ncbi:hypothetical protein JB92DRAFT_1208373 [Gautieria morchelliformis]|nr:hypothetical protein JB92DRAFT_1208373 [Gautieria morchelliformis]
MRLKQRFKFESTNCFSRLAPTPLRSGVWPRAAKSMAVSQHMPCQEAVRAAQGRMLVRILQQQLKLLSARKQRHCLAYNELLEINLRKLNAFLEQYEKEKMFENALEDFDDSLRATVERVQSVRE